eukprot:TRINITY_DN12556_c0_g1_i1.p1 TRINITY_DN12556_c0_g1~~TRINITY_DN12556_c0_g1_i1.p1  ORF type:complete len:120 (+),score=23.18 TRINITY_DN12556_c0_g1_i1:824-1183(+)
MALEEINLSRASSSLVWLRLVPLRVEAFCWLAVAAKVSTIDNLRKRGLMYSSISYVCVMCRMEAETVTIFFFILSLQLVFGVTSLADLELLGAVQRSLWRWQSLGWEGSLWDAGVFFGD